MLDRRSRLTLVRLVMLDAGWAVPREFLAHYKKAMDNIARIVVDIRVHTHGMSRDAMMRVERDDALQGEQLAGSATALSALV